MNGKQDTFYPFSTRRISPGLCIERRTAIRQFLSGQAFIFKSVVQLTNSWAAYLNVPPYFSSTSLSETW